MTRDFLFPLPFFLLPPSLPFGNPGLVSRDHRLSAGPEEGGKKPGPPSQPLRDHSTQGCVTAVGFFFHFTNQGGLRGGSAPAWLCPSGLAGGFVRLPAARLQGQTRRASWKPLLAVAQRERWKLEPGRLPRRASKICVFSLFN